MGGRALRITADTNLLLRTVLQDDERQSALADAVLKAATVIAVPSPVLCEFAWVLRRGYGYPNNEIAQAIKAICDLEAVVADQACVDLGLSILLAGGDFADGVIAQQGRRLGGGTFASFDEEAVSLLADQGVPADDPANMAVD